MSRVVYLHVGAPKTGTTYLQDRLALNRTALEHHGVYYPSGLHDNHFAAALDLIERPWGGLRDEVHGQWEALVGQARKHQGTVIISHEVLAAATSDQVERAMTAFAGDDVHLVYSARDLARQIPAEWQEGVKHRRGISFARFVSEIQNSPRTRSNLWFWRVQGLPDVLARWSRGLPPEKVHVVTVPQVGAPREQLWERFCQSLSIDPEWAAEDSEQLNDSIGNAEIAVLRKLNRRLKKAELDSAAYRSLIRQLVVYDTLADRSKMAKPTLSPGVYPWAAEVAEEWIEWVEGSGVQVSGDVNELRPVPSHADEQWEDPDRPRHQDMLDAALDAIVALAEEAASRPDPDVQITARLGRAARRLRRQPAAGSQ